MLHFYHFSFHSDRSSVVIAKPSLYYFLNYNIFKMIIYQILKDLSQVYPSFAMKTYYFRAITFSFGKEQIKYFISKNNYISEVFKKL